MYYKISTVDDNKRVGLIWAAIAVFTGVAILLGIIFPDIFKFWGCVGVFLTCIGITSMIIDKIMGKIGFPWTSTISILIGLLLIIVNVVCRSIGNIGIIAGATGLIIVGIMAGVSIALRKR